jgi:hypothetical protein
VVDAAPSDDFLDQSIAELRLPKRTHKALTSAYTWSDGRWLTRVTDLTIRELVAMSSNHLLREPNFGKVSLQQVRGRLAEHGLYLRDEGPPPPPQPTMEHRLQAIEAKLDLILSKLDAAGGALDGAEPAPVR